MVRRMGGTFQYLNPGTIHWGEGSVSALDAELSRAGVIRVFLITTGSIARTRQCWRRWKRRLARAWSERRQPLASTPRCARWRGRRRRCARRGRRAPLGRWRVAIDAAKAAAWSLAAGIDLAEPDALSKARGVRLTGKTVLPHFAVPTTLSVAELAVRPASPRKARRRRWGGRSGAGAEAVFYDAALAVHTPLDLWLSTGIRAVDHAVETVLAPGEHPLPDAAALEGLRLLSKGLRAVKEKPPDRAARTDCQVGAWLSYLLPGPAAKGLSHTLGKRIGSTHGIPHGVTSCLLLPHVMRFFITRRPEPLQRIAR